MRSTLFFVFVWAAWTGTFWGFVATFGWLIGSAAVLHAPLGDDVRLWGAIGVGATLAFVLFSAVLKPPRNKQFSIPVCAGLAAGTAYFGSAAIVVGWGRFAAVGAVLGFFLGALSAIPRVIVSVTPTLSVAVLSAVFGWTVGVVSYFTGDWLGYVAACALGMALVGGVDALFVQFSEDASSFVRWSWTARWLLSGFFAGAVAGALIPASASAPPAVQRQWGPMAFWALIVYAACLAQAWFRPPSASAGDANGETQPSEDAGAGDREERSAAKSDD